MKKVHNELDIEEDMSLQRRTWKIERISWFLMFLVLIAAVLGFTGKGGLGISQKKAGGTAAGLEVEYDRFLRQGAPTEMRVTFHQKSSVHRLMVGKEFIEKVRIEQIIPQPTDSELSSRGITYSFKSKGGGNTITFYLQPKKAGNLQAMLFNGSTSLSFNQFVYP